MKKLALTAVLVATVAFFGGKWYLHHKLEKGLEQAIMMASPFVTITYDSVSSTLDGKLSINGIVAREMMGYRDPLTIGSLGLDTPSIVTLIKLAGASDGDLRSLDDMPEYLGVFADDVRMPVDADYLKKLHQVRMQAVQADDADTVAAECTGKYGFSPAVLHDLGYSEQIVSAAITFRQQDTGGYSIEADTAIDDMWALDMVMQVAGDLRMDMSSGSSWRPKLNRLRVSYTDDSLKERVRRYCRSRGLSDDEIITAQLDAFVARGESSGIVFDDYVLDPYREYLAGKSTLVVTAEPNSPVDVSKIDLYKPSDVPALLNLNAEAL
ncbi:MAG: hypothetical protein AAFX58_04855 [Pseudomonadota bacterium]